MGSKPNKTITHIVTSPEVDQKLKDRAKKNHDKSNQPNYDVCGNNCHDYSDGMANLARWLKLKEQPTQGKGTVR
jgi:hypothetical protein